MAAHFRDFRAGCTARLSGTLNPTTPPADTSPPAGAVWHGGAGVSLDNALSLLRQSGREPPSGEFGSPAWMQGPIDALCGLSSRDALTGLANRRHFEMVLSREIDRVARAGEPALLLLDIDHFERVNDTHGHAAGDLVLKAVAEALLECVLLDTGAGISDVVLYTASLADEVLVVTTPEPTAMTDAYATIKVLATTQGRRALHLVVNQALNAGEGRAIRAQLQQVIDRYGNPCLEAPVKLDHAGDVPADAAVRESVQKRQLLLALFPRAPAARAVMALAARLVS